MLRGRNAQGCSAKHRMVFDQETFAKIVWQSTTYSSKLYQRFTNSDTLFVPSAIHQYNLTCPLALKGNHTWIENSYAALFGSCQFKQVRYDPELSYCITYCMFLLSYCCTLLYYCAIKTLKARNYNPAMNGTLVYVLNVIWRIYRQWLFKVFFN